MSEPDTDTDSVDRAQDHDIYAIDRTEAAEWTGIGYICGIKDCQTYIDIDEIAEDHTVRVLALLSYTTRFMLFFKRTKKRCQTIEHMHLCPAHFEQLIQPLLRTDNQPNSCHIIDCSELLPTVTPHKLVLCKEHYDRILRPLRKKSFFEEKRDKLFDKAES